MDKQDEILKKLEELDEKITAMYSLMVALAQGDIKLKQKGFFG